MGFHEVLPSSSVHVEYAYAPASDEPPLLPRSIARLAGVTPDQLAEAGGSVAIDLSHPKEMKLAKCIIRFPEVVAKVADDLFPHSLCDYLYDLCTTFTEFYDVCYCVEKDRSSGEVIGVNMSRLLLCEAVTQVLDKGFHLLGLEPVGRM